MIGAITDAVRTRVVAPQQGVTNPDARAYFDEDAAPLLSGGTAKLELVELSSTPINPVIGNAMGAPGGLLTMRHILAVVLTVEDSEAVHALARRNAIITDLLRRAITGIDWPNVDAGADQDIIGVRLGLEYAGPGPAAPGGGMAAYATLTFTVDAEWRL